jgi:hypothetical protein
MFSKINTKSIWFIFSPLLTSCIAGYLLYRFRGLSGGIFVIIILVGLIFTFVNCILVVLDISRKHN